MAQIKAVSYEEQRSEHFRKLMEKMQRKIDWWQSAGRSFNRNYNSRWHNECSEAGRQYSFYKDALEALNTQPKWISVEERLPEYDAKVLVVIPKYYGCDIRTARLYKSGAWLIGDMSAVGSTPTHWMPLPEPPKEG